MIRNEDQNIGNELPTEYSLITTTIGMYEFKSWLEIILIMI